MEESVTKAIVVFDSKFGNTEKVARALASGIEEAGVPVDCVRCGEARADHLKPYDLLAIGGPTQYGTVSKPLAKFLEELSRVDLAGKRGFAFDTRYADPRAGSAAEGIEAHLRERGVRILRPHASAIVLGGEGPLEEGSEATFRRIGRELAEAIR